jgi:hypothetical protein
MRWSWAEKSGVVGGVRGRAMGLMGVGVDEGAGAQPAERWKWKWKHSELPILLRSQLREQGCFGTWASSMVIYDKQRSEIW